jgi:hypothetical protein
MSTLGPNLGDRSDVDVTLGLMGPIIWPSKAHREVTRATNRSNARRRQPRSFSLLEGGSVPETRASNSDSIIVVFKAMQGKSVFGQNTQSSSATRTHKTLNAQASLAVAVLKTDIEPVPMNPLFWVLGTARPSSVKTAFP